MKLRAVLVVAAAISVAVVVYFVLRSTHPDVPMQPVTGVSVGFAADYAPGDVKPFPDHKFFVVCKDGRLYAVSSLCTHMQCETNWEPSSSEFKCTCHGSKFDADGTVLNPPANKPLPRYAIRDAGKAGIVVDTAVSSGDPADWDKDPYFVSLDAVGK